MGRLPPHERAGRAEPASPRGPRGARSSVRPWSARTRWRYDRPASETPECREARGLHCAMARARRRVMGRTVRIRSLWRLERSDAPVQQRSRHGRSPVSAINRRHRGPPSSFDAVPAGGIEHLHATGVAAGGAGPPSGDARGGSGGGADRPAHRDGRRYGVVAVDATAVRWTPSAGLPVTPRAVPFFPLDLRQLRGRAEPKRMSFRAS
jgi:hypothetical protein